MHKIDWTKEINHRGKNPAKYVGDIGTGTYRHVVKVAHTNLTVDDYGYMETRTGKRLKTITQKDQVQASPKKPPTGGAVHSRMLKIIERKLDMIMAELGVKSAADEVSHD